MSGWHPLSSDGGVPPNAATPTSPAQAFSPNVPPTGTEALYFSNGCDVTLRPHVLNTLISEGLALIDRVGLSYRPSLLTNLRQGVEYIVQKGQPKYVALTPQSMPAHDYFGILDPPLLGNLMNGMVLTAIPAAPNAGNVRINVEVGTGTWVPVLRNDGEPLEEADWLANVPQLVSYCNGNWYQVGLTESQAGAKKGLALTGGGIVNIQIFETPGVANYVPSEGASEALIICTAGGGGGGGAIGSGGGGGGTAITRVPVASWQVNVGAGGAGGGWEGAYGGASSVGTVAAANGGAGGWRGAAYSHFATGQAGGIGTVGNFLIRGCASSAGLNLNITGYGGFGGVSYWGGGGVGAEGNGIWPPGWGKYGGGGGGAYWASDPTGGRGGDGVVIFIELGWP